MTLRKPFRKMLNGWIIPPTLLFLVLIVASFCSTDEVARTQESANNPAEQDASPGLSAENHMDQIRKLYSKAMSFKKETQEVECDDDPLIAVIDVRAGDESILWLRRTSGYDHGSLSYEALYSAGEPLFVMKETTRWRFDIEAPVMEDGANHTVDTAEQHRYYFQDGDLVRALYKEAMAQSSKKESLDVMIKKATNRPHPEPQGQEALKMARAILDTFNRGGLNADWCNVP